MALKMQQSISFMGRIRRFWDEYFQPHSTTIIFIAVVILATFLMVLNLLVDRGATTSFLFDFNRAAWTNDTYADFYKSIYKEGIHGRFGKYDSIYPPLVELYYLFLAKLMHVRELGLSSLDLRDPAESGVFPVLVYAVITSVTIAAIVITVDNKFENRVLSCVLSFALIFTLPVIYSIERGNLILQALLFMLFFLLYYQSEKRWVRNLALFSLALAINIKLYPAIFLLLFVAKRDLRGFFTVIVESLLLFLIPLAAFKGFDTLKEIIYNILFTTDAFGSLGYGQKIGIYNTVDYAIALLSGNAHKVTSVPLLMGIMVIGTVLPCILAYFWRSKGDKDYPYWKVALLLGTTVALIPQFSFAYNLCFVIPALVLFLKAEQRMTRSNAVYLLLFLGTIMPIPFGVSDINPALTAQITGPMVYPMTLTCFVNSVCLVGLWLLSCVQLTKNAAAGLLRERRNACSAVS